MPTSGTRGPGPGAPTRARRALFVAVLVVQVLVLYAPDAGGAPQLPGLDLVVHATLFAAACWTGLRAAVPARPLVLALLAHAVVSEVVQAHLLPERTGDVLDALADAVGTLGVLVAFWAFGATGWARRRRRGIMGT